ncbi:MAG TPA: ImmA/IrrE family metallo-endopeptidase [Syntrophomonadaceae bacterium]|nr:ImmA/IrrE family metallo-endopeptidase [Syntrophomonadaceae bacterium]
MLLKLLRFAEKQGIIVDYWEFAPPIRAVYLPGDPPVIGLDKHLTRSELRTYLAEEISHHLVSVGNGIIQPHYSYREKLYVSSLEYRARKLAVNWLLPDKEFIQAMKKGLAIWELAELFDVTEDAVKFKMNLIRLKTALEGGFGA